jgi:hypothetical protein
VFHHQSGPAYFCAPPTACGEQDCLRTLYRTECELQEANFESASCAQFTHSVNEWTGSTYQWHVEILSTLSHGGGALGPARARTENTLCNNEFFSVFREADAVKFCDGFHVYLSTVSLSQRPRPEPVALSGGTVGEGSVRPIGDQKSKKTGGDVVAPHATGTSNGPDPRPAPYVSSRYRSAAGNRGAGESGEEAPRFRPGLSRGG